MSGAASRTPGKQKLPARECPIIWRPAHVAEGYCAMKFRGRFAPNSVICVTRHGSPMQTSTVTRVIDLEAKTTECPDGTSWSKVFRQFEAGDPFAISVNKIDRAIA